MSKVNSGNISVSQVEEGDIQSASFGGAITITANQIEVGDTQAAKFTVEQAVEIESSIPPDAKEAVRNFIQKQIDRVTEAGGEFILNIPDELAQFSEVILKIITMFVG